MTTNTDFFIESNAVGNVTEKDYERAAVLVDAVKAFARTTYLGVHVNDYFRQNFMYFSDNMAWLCGESAGRIQREGFGFYMKHMSGSDRQMLLELNRIGWEFIDGVPVESRLDYTITYDLHIVNGRRRRLVHHRITPLALSDNGHVWLALGTISIAARSIPGDIRAKKHGSNTYYEYSIQSRRWVEKEERPLSETERDVLTLSAQGYTMSEIADMLCKSIDAIKSCKQSLFSRLNVRNISEAISLAVNYKLL